MLLSWGQTSFLECCRHEGQISLLNIVVVGVKRSVVGMLPSLGSESNLVNSVNCELLLTALRELGFEL